MSVSTSAIRWEKRRRPARLFALAVGLAALWSLAAGDADTDPAVEESVPQAAPVARMVRVPLPITAEVEAQVRRVVDRLIDELPESESRPVFVFEFDPRDGQQGEGGGFPYAYALADYLSGERLAQVRRVAYLPRSVRGHAVLAVLACDQIVMHPDAELGEAGIDEQLIKPTVRSGYIEIAERRRLIPTPVVLGMLDPSLEIHRVQTIDAVQYVTAEEARQIQLTESVEADDTIIDVGAMGRFTGFDMRNTHRWASHLARDRRELATALGLAPGALEDDPSGGKGWRSVRVDLHGPVNGKSITWIARSLEERLADDPPNFLCVWIDSPGGSPVDSMRLANELAALDPNEIRTVAFVPNEARGDAALVALACDHLVLGDAAVLGGPGAYEMGTDERADIRHSIRALGEAKQRDWSMMAALVDTNLEVYRFTDPVRGETRYFCDEEWQERGDSDRWTRGRQVDTGRGLTGKEAEEIHLARFRVRNYDEFKNLYHLTEEPELLRPNWAHTFVERFANKLASPWLAHLLLFFAFVALLSEASTPGIGVAGFVSAMCFLLFFWSQFLSGTAGWLEVLLFLVGMTFVVVEIFVTPGFGILGIGGALMVIVSVVLASQTFVIPRNAYQLERLPYSLSMVLAGGAGIAVALFVFRRYLPNTPFARRMMLKPVGGEQLDELQQRESLVRWNHLLGKRGVTTTSLSPSGKARFGDDVVAVISEGEHIAQGADVVVADVQGNRVIVRSVGGDPFYATG